jgi:flavodoxin
MKTLILYHTKTGHTLEAINPTIEGLKSGGSEVNLVQAKDFKNSMLSENDAIIVGTPCWSGSIGISGVATPIVKVLKKLPDNSLKDKTCGGIAVHAKYGGEATLNHLRRLLSSKGCENLITAPVVKAGVLMSLYKGPSVKKSDEEKLKEFGEKFINNQ